MKELKKNMGITLIALIVTIIVLLILASVSIAMITGESGILIQAQKAKEKTEESAKKEQEDLISIEESLQEVARVTDKNPGELEGEGSKNKPFIINSIEDLVVFAYNVTNGNTYEGQYVKLGQSLDFKSDKSYVNSDREDYSQYGYIGKLKESLTNGEGFKGIGKVEEINEIEEYSFKGNFDGNNKTIYNIYINRKVEDSTNYINIGMFSKNYGIIKNLSISGGSISLLVSSSRGYVGGISGNNYGTIEYCKNKCNVIGSSQAENVNIFTGGIIGRNDGNIEFCKNEGSITGVGIGMQIQTGGIVGFNNNSVRSCYNIGKVQGKGGEGGSLIAEQIYVGGIVGINWINKEGNLNIEKCYNEGEVNGENGYFTHVGGIVGHNANYGNVNQCCNVSNVTGKKLNEGTQAYIGGICGLTEINTTIYNCYYLNTYINVGIGYDDIDAEKNLISIKNINEAPSVKEITEYSF